MPLTVSHIYWTQRWRLSLCSYHCKERSIQTHFHFSIQTFFPPQKLHFLGVVFARQTFWHCLDISWLWLCWAEDSIKESGTWISIKGSYVVNVSFRGPVKDFSDLASLNVCQEGCCSIRDMSKLTKFVLQMWGWIWIKKILSINYLQDDNITNKSTWKNSYKIRFVFRLRHRIKGKSVLVINPTTWLFMVENLICHSGAINIIDWA